MEKEIKDYLHLYLGCDVIVPDEKEPCTIVAINTQSIFIDSGCDYPFSEIKPILRPLSDMTEEEWIEFNSIATNDYSTTIQLKSVKEVSLPHEFAGISFLLSKHFDLFGLIEAGLAIDKTVDQDGKTINSDVKSF